MSTVSPGMTNSDVAVEPSVTVIEVGLKVIPVIVAEGQGFDTVIVTDVAVGVKEVVAPWPWPLSIVMVFAIETV